MTIRESFAFRNGRQPRYGGYGIITVTPGALTGYVVRYPDGHVEFARDRKAVKTQTSAYAQAFRERHHIDFLAGEVRYLDSEKGVANDAPHTRLRGIVLAR
jgi:hypothetical protein